MARLSDDIIRFFMHQHFVIVSTFDRGGFPHTSCKGVVKVGQDGKLYLLDLYKARTYENLRHNSRISVTAVDEHKFKGYCLKGKAKIIKASSIKSHIIRAWEEKITARISHRIVKNISGHKGHPQHPEAMLPKPEYLIVMKTQTVVNLTPGPLINKKQS